MQSKLHPGGGKWNMRRPDRRRALYVLLPVLGLLTLACTCSGLMDPMGLFREAVAPEAGEVMEGIETLQASRGTATPRPQGGDSLPDLLASGSVEVAAVESNSEGETQGKVLTVQFANPGSNEVIVDVPCGLVFHPVSSAEDQRMMVIQPGSAVVPPAGDAELSPYVVCIDPERDAPSLDSTYQVGEVESGALGDLAQCLCGRSLGEGLSLEAGMETMAVQFAVWSVSTGQSPKDLFGGQMPAGSAVEEMLGEEGGQMLEGLQELVAGPAQDLLEECGIELEGE